MQTLVKLCSVASLLVLGNNLATELTSGETLPSSLASCPLAGSFNEGTGKPFGALEDEGMHFTVVDRVTSPALLEEKVSDEIETLRRQQQEAEVKHSEDMASMHAMVAQLYGVVKDLTAALGDFKRENQTLVASVKGLAAEVQSLKDENEGLLEAIGNLGIQNQGLQQEMKALKEENQHLSNQVQQLTKARNALRDSRIIKRELPALITRAKSIGDRDLLRSTHAYKVQLESLDDEKFDDDTQALRTHLDTLRAAINDLIQQADNILQARQDREEEIRKLGWFKRTISRIKLSIFGW